MLKKSRIPTRRNTLPRWAAFILLSAVVAVGLALAL